VRAACTALAAAALLAGAARAHEDHAAGSPGAATAAPAPAVAFEPPEAGSYALPPITQVADRALTGTDGGPAPLLGLGPGEVAFVSFVYLSCPEGCPLATAVLQELDRRLARDRALAARVQLVTVSFDPARDTPDAMARLARGLAPRGRWRFLTARDAAELEPLLADFGQDAVPLVAEAGAPQRLAHVLKVFLVDDAGRVRNVYSSGFLDARLLENDARTVLAGSSASAGARRDAVDESSR
jgi:cytochrome oxidase Cu insertion factor (SCO1/SenC/PrrC family)